MARGALTGIEQRVARQVFEPRARDVATVGRLARNQPGPLEHREHAVGRRLGQPCLLGKYSDLDEAVVRDQRFEHADLAQSCGKLGFVAAHKYHFIIK